LGLIFSLKGIRLAWEGQSPGLELLKRLRTLVNQLLVASIAVVVHFGSFELLMTVYSLRELRLGKSLKCQNRAEFFRAHSPLF